METIRQLYKGDIEQVCDLIEKCSNDKVYQADIVNNKDYTLQLIENNHCVCVEDENNKIVGFVLVKNGMRELEKQIHDLGTGYDLLTDKDSMELLNVLVEPDRRRQGLATSMSNYCLKHNPDIKMFWARTHISNVAARSTLKSIGFNKFVETNNEKYYKVWITK